LNTHGDDLRFQSIETILSEKNLKNPELEVLYPDVHLYSAALYQPSGGVTGDSTRVGNLNPTDAEKKHISFLNQAKEAQSSIAITPEYSCPWSAIEKLLAEDTFPEHSKLWIVGCESISVENLHSFKSNHQEKYEIFFETISPQTGRFLDPVCLFFKTEDQSGQSKQVILIQFKTQSMGDAPNHYERDNLIRGDLVYIIRGRDTNSIRLVTFICSDVLGITNDQIKEILTRTLIVHIQLNPNPRSITFAQYRTFCFDATVSDCEVLSVNWAQNIQCAETTPSNWNNIAGSCLYFKTDKLNTFDERINQNHARGLYLTYWERFRTYAYFFNYNEHVFLFRCTKPWQFHGTPQQAGRSGPEALGVKSWNKETEGWVTEVAITDGFEDQCKLIMGDLTALSKLHDNPISIERLLTLSHGEAKTSLWHKIEHQSFFHIKQEEIIQRISFAQDNHADAIENRQKYLRLFSTLTHIVSDQNNFPVMISNLKQGGILNYSEQEPHRNLYAPGLTPATVVYVGENPSFGDVERVYTNLKLLLNESDRDSNRLLIWYRDIAGQTKYYPQELRPNADEDPAENPASITRS
jgi:hypothetical protein